MKYHVNTNKDNLEYLLKKKISNVQCNDNNISFETNENSLKLLIGQLNNIDYVNKRKNNIVSFIKKYLISIIAIFIIFLLFINEQFVIREIVFLNENTYNEEVTSYLYNNKIEKKFGFCYLNDNIININKDIKQKFYYYEWISVNKKGNKLEVIIDKQDEKSFIDNGSNIFGDLYSNRDGIIRYYFIKKGVNLIKDNQSIKKGDILISGNLLINNNGILYTHPIGIVLAEVVDYEIVKVKKNNYVYLRTGKIEQEEGYSFFGKNRKDKCSFNMYDVEESIVYDYKIIKKYKKIYYEVKEVEISYIYEEAEIYSKSYIYKKFNDYKINEKERIINCLLISYFEDDDYYYFKYLVKKIINIAEFKAVNLEEN